jgi:hypothetical protein
MEKKKYNAPKVKIAVMEDLMQVAAGSTQTDEGAKPSITNSEPVQEPLSSNDNEE